MTYKGTSHAPLIASGCAALALLLAAPAIAAPGGSCDTGQENASVNQYCESVPTSEGPRGADDDDPDGQGSVERIPESTREELSHSELGRTLLEPGATGDRESSHGDGAGKKADGRQDPPGRAARPAAGVTAEANFSATDALGGLPTWLRFALPLVGGALIVALARPLMQRARRRPSA
jgi:hypothetical protein